MATGLSTAITKDGQTTTTARVPFAQGISSTLVTDATSATTGSIITAGGISTQKALWVGTTTTLAGALTYGGVTLTNSVTGTGSMVLSASPTITGTLTGAAATFSGNVTVNNANAGVPGLVTIGNASISNGAAVRFLGALGQKNWQLGHQINVSDVFEFTPSTVNGGSTFTTPVLTLSSTVASFSGAVSVSSTSGYLMSVVGSTNGAFRGYEIRDGNTNIAGWQMKASTGEMQFTAGFPAFGAFYTWYRDGAEVMRIDSSGNLLVGTTTNPNNGRVAIVRTGAVTGFSYQNNTAGSTAFVAEFSGTTGTFNYALWFYNGSQVGSITSTGTTTAYNTSSDYRLKKNVLPMTGGLATVAALKPVTYDWISNGSAGEGFIAHELQAVIPAAVTGEKDAVDDKGEIKPQGVDFGKIVPHLVAAIQELTARLTALETK